ncbi:MAG: hypothetical protein QM726_14435 [Chitinophagaceae bacterium]
MVSIELNGEDYKVTTTNIVLFPDGREKRLFKDDDGNWIFDVNDGDYMLADILGNKLTECGCSKV